MDLEELASFLKKANKSTYASERAEKAVPLRPCSSDYEYSDGNYTYHDTYFGGTQFIGEEVIYKDKKPIWAMNYNGYVTDTNITEAEIDKSLRGALKQDYDDIIPVRGPLRFEVDEYIYTNMTTGDLSRFEGREEITKKSKLIYFAVFHGGLIK